MTRWPRWCAEKIKYVFVIFNENHSFDNEYGTFPGRRRPLFRRRQAARRRRYAGLHANLQGCQRRQRDRAARSSSGRSRTPAFIDSVDHSHKGLARKLHVVDGAPRMDRFAADEYRQIRQDRQQYEPGAGRAIRAPRDVAYRLRHDSAVLAFCQPNFTIFDNIFATEDTPSTPNAIAMIAGQAGETQWVKHGAEAKTPLPMSGAINGKTYSGSGRTAARSASSTIPIRSGVRNMTRRSAIDSRLRQGRITRPAISRRT